MNNADVINDFGRLRKDEVITQNSLANPTLEDKTCRYYLPFRLLSRHELGSMQSDVMQSDVRNKRRQETSGICRPLTRRDSLPTMKTLDAASLFVVGFCLSACGSPGRGAPAVQMGVPSAVSRDAGAEVTPNTEPTVNSEAPNVPFAMLGGGPRHLHRAEVHGPDILPREIARFRCGARVFASPVVGPDGTIYIGSIDGTFNALRSDGRLRWSYVCDEPIFSTAAVSQIGTVYVGCDDDSLLAFSTDGMLRWTYTMKHDVDSAPTIGANGVVYVGGDGLHALRADGERVFKVWLGGHVSASPTVRSDGVVVVGSHDHRVYAVGSDGAVAWSFATKKPVQGQAAALDNDDVVFGSDDGFVYRLSPLGGARWKFKTGGPIRSGVAVAADEKTLYFGSMDGSVYCVDAVKGKEIWHFETAGSIQGTPLLDSRGNLYVGSRDHHLYAIDSASGELRWRIDLGSEIDSTPALAAGGRLVIGSDDGVVRILEEAR